MTLLFASCWLSSVAITQAQESDEPKTPSVEAALDSVPDDPAVDADDEKPSAKQPKAARFTDLGQAVTDAAKRRQGVFILFTAAWCPWCKKELKVFDEPDVAEALKSWTVAVIDVDEHPKVAKRAGVESLPTVQVQTVDGRIIASQNGFLEPDELIAWLKEHREAILLSGDEFAGDDPPNDETRDRLLEQFQNRNPVAREAAVQRLLKHRQHVAAAVAKRLETGPLQTRLTAWELLHEWKAPVDAIDPWNPESLTPEMFAALKAWVERIDPSAKDDAPLSPEQVIELDDEISALLQTDDPAQQRTIRERLARHGPKLLPVIYAQLAKADNQQARDRLTVLRYRVVSPTTLVLRWPNGLERLAGENAEERHAAVMELTQQVSSAEEGLLLELFSDPDPFVRELCLRALRDVGGSSANMALLRLLDDPSPDVRAAVLGQLAESPSPQVVPQLSAYIEKETDADLIVHAVRALRAVGNEAAIECLLTLFEHAGWHVRAEAVEAVGEILQTRRRSSSSELPRQAQIYAAIKSRLADEDGFVVSRSVGALRQANLSSAVDAMAEAARRKPELAAEIVQAISGLNAQNRTVTTHLRAFAVHEDPQLRSAALGGLLTIGDSELHQHMQHGLEDAERSVRIAAAETLFELLNRELPTGPARNDLTENDAESPAGVSVGPGSDVAYVEEVIVEEQPTTLIGSLFKSILGGGQPAPRAIRRPVPRHNAPPSAATGDDSDSDVAEDVPSDEVPADAQQAVVEAKRQTGPPGNDAELLAYDQRSERPDWQTAALESLQTMLASDDPEEQLAAALPLVPLGQVDAVWPIVLHEARNNGAEVGEISRLLSWLVWDRRSELFEALLSQPAARQQIEKIGRQFVFVKDRRTEDYVWNLLAGPQLALSEFPAWHTLLMSLYGVLYRNSDTKPPAERILSDWKARAAAGTALQKLMSACLLYQDDKEQAVAIARDILGMTDAAAGARADALQIVLLGDSTEEARSRAVALLIEPAQPVEIRRIAIGYLAIGSRALSYLRATHLWIDTQAYYHFDVDLTSNRTPGDWGEPPEEITPHDLRPFLASQDAEVAAYAAFLSVWIHGDRLAWQQLLEQWQQKQKSDVNLNRLVYRAVAALDDESLIPVLTKVYEQIHEDHREVKEFYWTVRSLTGPEILKLRKRIRDEVGMDQLRN